MVLSSIFLTDLLVGCDKVRYQENMISLNILFVELYACGLECLSS